MQRRARRLQSWRRCLTCDLFSLRPPPLRRILQYPVLTVTSPVFLLSMPPPVVAQSFCGFLKPDGGVNKAETEIGVISEENSEVDHTFSEEDFDIDSISSKDDQH